MGDFPRHRPRSAYAQPGEIDTSLVEAESLRPRPAAEPNLNRPIPTPVSSIPESRPSTSGPVAERERKSLGSVHAAESRPSPLRPNPPTNPFYKGLAPAGNVVPSRKGLASAPGLVEGKPAAFRLGTDPGLSHGNPALQRGLAPPPGAVSGQRKSGATENPHALPAQEPASEAGRFCSLRDFVRRQAALESGRP